MKTINITLKIEDKDLLEFEDKLRNTFKVISLKVIPNTDKLYENDKYFKKLVKDVKKIQIIRDTYINDHNL